MTLIERLFNKFLGYLLPAARLLARSGGALLIQAAQEAVLAAEAAGGGGAAKYNAARKSIENSLKRQGIPLVANAINLAIETAVASMNSK